MSARIASQEKSSPASSPSKSSPSAGSKRKGESSSSPAAKRGRKSSKKEQKTLEEIVDPDGSDEKAVEEKPDEDVKETNEGEETKEKVIATGKEDKNSDQDAKVADTQESIANTGASEESDAKKIDQSSSANADAPNGDTAVEPNEREEETPSSILEKGIIYFFFRGRVGIDHPSNPQEIARSYFVLRPLPHGAKLTDGPIGDAGNSRLLALPKKILPMSHRDRFMSFVEKSGTSFNDLKENFLASNDYVTKTAGTRHTPAATPVAEGVYAITSTGRESHLAYILTIPNELTDVQTDIGLRERGSFVVSLRNPQYEAPASAQLPQTPEFPKEILDEFRALRWMPLQPKHLNYANAQFLLIGESGGHLGKAVEEQPADQQDDKKRKPEEEMEKLEHEDEIRVKHLKGDDAVFADLGLNAKEYPRVQTTW